MATNVYDAFLRKKRFVYNENHRPIEVQHFVEKNMYSIQGYVWDESTIKKPKQIPSHLYALNENDVEQKSPLFSNVHALNSLTNKKSTISIPSLVNSQPANALSQQNKELGSSKPGSNQPIATSRNYAENAASLVSYTVENAFLSTQTQGNLLATFFKTGNGTVLHAQDFAYDKKGNVLRERFFGNLSGECHCPVILHANNTPVDNGTEIYSKYFNYKNDGHLSLLHIEYEDNGKGMVYDYKPQTDLVQAKYITERDFTTNQDNIRFREFYSYDENTTLTCLIKDDGTSPSQDDLTGVSERLLTYFYPRSTAPYGLPERIDEMYFDFQTQKEVLLKRLICHYTVQGKLIQQDHYDANNQYAYSLYWEYDAHGNTIKEVNALGEETLHAYDENDNLILTNGPYFGFFKKYTYDFVNRLTQYDEIQPDMTTYTTKYTYDYVGNKTQMIDRFGQVTQYFYDDLNRLVKTVQAPVVNEDAITIQPTEEIVYNELNKPVCLIDPNGYKTHLEYNSRGQVTSKTYPDGSNERFVYSLNGMLFKHIAVNQLMTVYHRDYLGRVGAEAIHAANGEMLSVTYQQYQGSKLIKKINAEGCETIYTYDGAGRLLSETCQDAYKTYTYDALGRVSIVSQAYGFEDKEVTFSCYEYDLLNRVTEESIKDGQGTVINCKKYVYNHAGQRVKVIEETEAGPSVTQVIYDLDKKPIKLIDAEGNETHIHYSFATINEIGMKVLQIETVDPHQVRTYQTYDTLGRLERTLKKDKDGIILMADLNRYNAAGQLIKTYHHVYANGEHIRDYITAWTYHLNGQIESQTEAANTLLQKSTFYHYNSFGQQIKLLKPDKTVIQYSYDPFGRLETLSASDNSIAYQYRYNLSHEIVEVIDHLNQTSTKRSYNLAGQLTEEELGNGLRFYYAYDRLGRVIHAALPDNSKIHYRYHATYLKEIERDHQGETYTHHYLDRDNSGNLLNMRLIKQAGNINYHYDILSRAISIQAPGWQQAIPKHGFDAVGLLKKSLAQDKIGLIENHYTYDDLHQLTSEKGHFPNTYHSDSIHNRLQKNQIPYEINLLNQIDSQNGYHYAYDFSGNLIEKLKDNQITFYRYDALNRLIEVQSDQELVNYTYDAFNRRLTRKSQSKTELFLYQGQNEIGTASVDGSIQQLRILSPTSPTELGSAVALELNGHLYAPIHDRQGHVVSLINAQTGQTTETYRYSAFGEEEIFDHEGQKISTSNCNNPWRYASKRIDPETNWIYFGRRYYDREVGRWTTADPLWFADGPNLYAYLHQSPLKSFDAFGYFDESSPLPEYDLDPLDFGGAFPSYEKSEIQSTSPLSSSIGEGVCKVAETCFPVMNSFFHGYVDGALDPLSTGLKRSPLLAAYNYFNTSETGFSESYQTKANQPHENFLCSTARAAGEFGGIVTNQIVANKVTVAVFGMAVSTIGAGCRIAGNISTKVNACSQTIFKAAFGSAASEATVCCEMLAQKGSVPVACEINTITSKLAQEVGKKGADFIGSANGVVIPTSRKVLEKGFQEAGFTTYPTRAPGLGYNLPNNLKVRVMEPSGEAGLRASFQHSRDSPINPFTGKPPQRPKHIKDISTLEYVRQYTHLDLSP